MFLLREISNYGEWQTSQRIWEAERALLFFRDFLWTDSRHY